MVAERDRVRTGIEKLLVNRLGDSKTAGGVLAVDDDEIELPVPDHAGQMFGYGGAAGLADHVADEKNTQVRGSGNRISAFPLAHNPAPRRATTPEQPRFPARRRPARWPRWL